MAKEAMDQGTSNAQIAQGAGAQELLLKKKLEQALAEVEKGEGSQAAGAFAAEAAQEVAVAVDGASASDAADVPTWALVGGAVVVAGAGIALAGSDDGDNKDGGGSTPPPVPNTPPAFSSPTAAFSVAENTTAVGTLVATDADGDALSYAISGGADAASFVITPGTQTLSFVSAPDFETQSSYTVEVTATDDNGGTATQVVTVTVTDVNETPDQDPGDGTPDAPKTIVLTTGIDIVELFGDDTVFGDESTLNTGDRITGNSGHVVLQFTGPIVANGFNITNVDDITISSTGGLTLLTSNWTDIGSIILLENTDAVVINDLQSVDTFFEVNDFLDPAGSLDLNFDAQALTGATVVNMSVQEVIGVDVSLGGGGIETVNLGIADVAADADSTLASFDATGMTRLNISGGDNSLNFAIASALQGGLQILDASGADSNLSLDVSGSNLGLGIDVTLGSGDDALFVGDTLGDLAEGDTFNDVGGYDTLYAYFGTVGTRAPYSENIEHFYLSFGDSAKLDMENVDDVQTITIAGNAPGINTEIVDMDNTVSLIHLVNQQYYPDGIEYGEFRFEDGAMADLDFVWSNNSGGTAYFTGFAFEDVKTLDVVFDGADDVYSLAFGTGLPTWALDDVTTDLSFTVEGTGDVFSNGIVVAPVLANLNFIDSSIENLSFATTANGDMIFGTDFSPAPAGGNDALGQAESLENLTLSSSESGLLWVGSIGDIFQARNLETITVDANATVSSFIPSIPTIPFGTVLGFVNADLNNVLNGASISTIEFNVGADANFFFGGLSAEDVSEMTVTLDNKSYTYLGYYGFILDQQGDTLSVSGTGYLGYDTFGNNMTFLDEAFAEMDFSGLANTGVIINFAAADEGNTHLVATGAADYIYSGFGSDAINLGGGSDILIDVGGSNVVVAGGGADVLVMVDGVGADRFSMGGTGVGAGGGTDDTIIGFDVSDKVSFGGAAPAATASNYAEGANVDFATSLAAANVAMGGGANAVVYYFSEIVPGSGFLFYDADADGTADLYVELAGSGVNLPNFDPNNVIAGNDPVFTGV